MEVGLFADSMILLAQAGVERGTRGMLEAQQQGGWESFVPSCRR